MIPKTVRQSYRHKQAWVKMSLSSALEALGSGLLVVTALSISTAIIHRSAELACLQS